MENSQLFFQVLWLVPVDFFLSGLPPIILCCLPCERRAHLGRHAIAAIVFSMLWCFGCTALFLYGLRQWVPDVSMILNYLMLMAGLFIVVCILFKASLSSLLFNLLGGFSVYQISLFLFNIIYSAIPETVALTAYTAPYLLLKYLWLCLAYVCAYYCIIRKQNQSYDDTVDSRKPVLVFSVCLCLFLMSFNIVREGDVPKHTLLDAMCLICLILFYALILLFRGGLLESIATEKELMLSKRVWEEKEKSLRMTQEAVTQINIRYHDLRHFASRLQSGEDRTALAEDLTTSLSPYEDAVSTGNDTLDMVLTEHRIRCRQQGVRFTCMADGSCLSFISALDLISLFSNALENAFEAVSGLEEARREILLSVSQKMGMVLIRVENEFDASLDMRNGLPQTTKQDRSYHGFGMKSIRQTVEKYGGDLQVETENHRFMLKILIPIPKE